MVELGDNAACSAWQIEGYPLTVEWSPVVLEGIRVQAVDGYNAFIRGGLETGGVLYGIREGDLVRVLHFGALASEHSEGPNFVLSAKDVVAFTALMKAPPGLEPVGMYCSHTRSELEFNAGDKAVFNRFFPQPGQIAVIVKPNRFGPAEGTFYYREPGGELCDPAPKCRFAIDPPKDPQFDIPPTAVPAASPARVAGVPLQHMPPRTMPGRTMPGRTMPLRTTPGGPAPVQPVLEEPAIAPAESRSRRLRLLWLAPGVALVLLAPWGLATWLDSENRKPPAIGLRAYGVGDGQVRIDWDRRSSAVLHAHSGTLEISDGASRRTVPLDADQLRTSSLTYVHQSDEFSLRLRLEGDKPGDREVEESIRFVAPARTAKAQQPVVPPATLAATPPKPSAFLPPIPAAKSPAAQPPSPASAPPKLTVVPPATPGSVQAVKLAASQPATGAAVPVLSAAAAPPPKSITAPAPSPAAAKSATAAAAPAPTPLAAKPVTPAATPAPSPATGPPAKDTSPPKVPANPVPATSADLTRSRKPGNAPEPVREVAGSGRGAQGQANLRPLDQSAVRAPASDSSTRSFALSDPPMQAAGGAPAPSISFIPQATVAAPVSVPHSGRVVWTGSLGKRGVLEIQGGSVTVGSLNGVLPGVPLTLKISPAELGSGGLVVYTSDASRNARREPATQATGGNAVRYEWDPARARQVTVLEAPNAGNQFKRLVLRNELRHCSLILIEWTAK